jgi:polyferredoxin
MESIRKLVQLIAVFLSNGYFLFPQSKNIYQGPLKVICSPGLNCYSCPASTTSCPIGAIQQLLLGIRFSLETGAYFFSFYVVGTIGLIATTTGRITCGWLCPFGLLQELLHKVPCGKKKEVYNILRYVKYFMLIAFVFLFPLLLINDWGMGKPWFCKYVCPAGTLEAGLPMLLLQPDLRATLGYLFYNKLFWMIVFLLWSVFTSRPFCKTTCPLGAFYGMFNKFSLFKLELIESRCTECGKCAQVCPMGIQFNESVGSTECIMCMRCMKEGCEFGAIHLTCGNLSLTANQRLLKKKISVIAGKG